MRHRDPERPRTSGADKGSATRSSQAPASAESRFNAEQAFRQLSHDSEAKLARLGEKLQDQEALYRRLRTEIQTLRSLVAQMRQESATLKAMVRGTPQSRPGTDLRATPRSPADGIG